MPEWTDDYNADAMREIVSLAAAQGVTGLPEEWANVDEVETAYEIELDKCSRLKRRYEAGAMGPWRQWVQTKEAWE